MGIHIKKRNIFTIIISIVYGTAITLISGFYSNTGGIEGAGKWGYPLYWKSKILASPNYSPPMNIEWIGLILDIMIWSILIYLILLIINRTFNNEENS